MYYQLLIVKDYYYNSLKKYVMDVVHSFSVIKRIVYPIHKHYYITFILDTNRSNL